MQYLPEDQVAWLQRALTTVPEASTRDEITRLTEAAFAVGYTRGHQRAAEFALAEFIRRMLEAITADIAADPEPKPLIPPDAPPVPPSSTEPPTAKVKRAPFADSALSVLDQGWKPEEPR